MKTLNDFVGANKSLFRQEELLLETTELIARIMNQSGVTQAQLAKRLGCSKAHISQCLSGEQNLTLRTLSDLFGALGYHMQVGAAPIDGALTKPVPRLYPIGGWSFEQKSTDCTETVIDCAATKAEEAYDLLEAAA